MFPDTPPYHGWLQLGTPRNLVKGAVYDTDSSTVQYRDCGSHVCRSICDQEITSTSYKATEQHKDPPSPRCNQLEDMIHVAKGTAIVVKGIAEAIYI